MKKSKLFVCCLTLLAVFLLFGGTQVMAQQSDPAAEAVALGEAAPLPEQPAPAPQQQPAAQPAPEEPLEAPPATGGEVQSPDPLSPAGEVASLEKGAQPQAVAPEETPEVAAETDASFDPDLHPLTGVGDTTGAGAVRSAPRPEQAAPEAAGADGWQIQGPQDPDQPDPAEPQADTPGWHYNEKQQGWYFVDQEGNRATGWLTIDGIKYYIDPASGLMSTGWVSQDGWYYFHPESGWMVTGWMAENAWWYFLSPENGKMHTGWMEDAAAHGYYFFESGQMATGWNTIGGGWYYFHPESGWMAKGWLQDGGWYYMSPENGVMRTGWFGEGANIYYFTPSGQMATGWMTTGSNWYYFYPDSGWLAKGWLNANGWFYMETENGVMQTGWLELASGTYYLAESGLMATNWVNLGGGWHYFFPATGHMATGWVELGRYLYHFDEKTGIMDHEELVNTVMWGIDVSVYQGVIDWAAVKESGVDFAIIRMLTWSNAAGGYVIDPYFDYNVRQAKANGIMVGVYLFSYAFNEGEMAQEVNFFANHPVVQQHRAEGIVYDLPVFIDFEWETTIRNTTYQGRTNMLAYGLALLDNYGYTPGFYSNLNWALNYYNAAYLQGLGYDFWLANYKSPNTPNRDPYESNGWNSPDLWQYSSTGRVNGINGNVDLNFCYTNYTFH